MKRRLLSTISGVEYPFDSIGEFADNGESLEVAADGIAGARVLPGRTVLERYAQFMPFDKIDTGLSLGEGNTPLVRACSRLRAWTGIGELLLKNETQNPTWSFKDRGSLACVAMAREMGEQVTATISTGNMGHSIAAYAGRAGLRAIVFVPAFAPKEKVQCIAFHGATVLRVQAPDYSVMKNAILALAPKLGLRIVSGNGPIRVEGYKTTAFELYEQLGGEVPDFIAVPTSACGHIRGIFKGFRELLAAGLITRLPRMIVVQAANCSPVVSAINGGAEDVIPFTNFHTVAEAITGGNPAGGREIVVKARQYGWPAASVTEEEILECQRQLAAAGFFVEPAAATSLGAVRKLRASGAIAPDARVVLVLTGSGLKDMDAMRLHALPRIDTDVDAVAGEVEKLLRQ